ncbi:ATP-binding protein [Streptomyces sp. NPDC015032]|uniref:ATP-binding protein n=1 Tax=Streptomyces sp. NPDC015032 TaxID=3364937 RepID=UPI0036FBDA5A
MAINWMELTAWPTLTPARRHGHREDFREPKTATEARCLVRVSLSAWELDHATDPADLVISELVANAVRHPRGPMVRVIVERPADDQVYLGVVDRAPNDLPQQQTPHAEAAQGRGLLMVDAFTTPWGYDRLQQPAGQPRI